MEADERDFAAGVAATWVDHLSGIDPLLLEIAVRLERTLKHLNRELEMALEKFHAEGIRNMEDFRLLALLRRVGPKGATTTEASREIGITKAATSTRVDRLVTAGLIEREASEFDRRETILNLRAPASGLVDECQRATMEVYQTVLSQLSKKERGQLNSLLTSLSFPHA